MSQPAPSPRPYAPKGKIAIGAAMRNEGCFVLEWVAYHLGIGFDKIIVYTNNCQDGTDAILSRLAQVLPGRVIHRDEEVPPGLSVQGEQWAKMRLLPEMNDVEFISLLDADEFLVVTAGEGRIQDLLALHGEADCIAMLWKHFGDAGMTRWTHGRVLTRQTRCEGRPHYEMHKSIFRPEKFDGYAPHHPKIFLATPEQPEPKIVNTIGIPMRFQENGGQNFLSESPKALTWENACIHHHAIRSPDIMMLKNLRGRGYNTSPTPKYKLGSRFMVRINRNGRQDDSALRHDHRTRGYLDAFLADPTLAHLHRQAEAWLDDIRREILTPEQIRAWSVQKSIYWKQTELVLPQDGAQS